MLLRQTNMFYLTRLETRTKESNVHASLQLPKHASVMKMTAGIPAPVTNYSIERGLSLSMFVRTRKMVNYVWVG